MTTQPLSDQELDKLTGILARFGAKGAMNLEQLDGFFAALIAGPDDVPPSEYLPEIWGDGMVNEHTFRAQEILHDFLSLITRHWNAVSQTLTDGALLRLIETIWKSKAGGGARLDGTQMKSRTSNQRHQHEVRA